jgi:malonate-semialdehyde dehydrogenase (acetylating) / methylmalonate-semialdehyde dehydrogenase
MRTIQHWITGSETAGAGVRFGPVYNPATGAQQARVALAEPADVDADHHRTHMHFPTAT